MSNSLKYLLLLVGVFFACNSFADVKPVKPVEPDPYYAPVAKEEKELDVKGVILEHLADSYEWHLWSNEETNTHVTIPLPVILYSKTKGLNIFSSCQFHHGESEYNGFFIAKSGEYKDKIVEKNAEGEVVRPLDFSITKNAFALFFICTVLIIMILSVARFYKKEKKSGVYTAPKGFVGAMEMLIMSIVDDVIKPSIGPEYKKYTPYLLTAFFFIFVNNLFGLIPIFPFGANTTGNIAVTFVLAIFTFIIVNVNGTSTYWKHIFWPDVPLFLKPLMIIIEIVEIFTKPFSLMIRLFANILAGHSIVLGLTMLIFVTASLGVGINASMTVASVLLNVFILFIELLVAFIQAYVFTMLSAVYIGSAREKHHQAHD